MIHIEYGDGSTKYGPGVDVHLDGDDIARAIFAYLLSHDIWINGPRTVKVNGSLVEFASVYVDPSGIVVSSGRVYDGHGAQHGETEL